MIAKALYLEEVDETLILTKSEFLNRSISILEKKDIPLWNQFNENTKITNSIGLKTDTLFNTSYYNYIENENVPYRELNAPISINGDDYTLKIKVNLLESEDLIMAVVILYISILLFLFMGILLINKYLSNRLWRPFYQTLQQIEQFEIDKNQKPHFSHTEIEEFDRLSKSVESLIEKNIVIYNNQREFVENAAHELQTPIAVIKAKIESLIQRNDVTEGQWEILNTISNTISRLNKLNKNLLLLSKIDKHYYSETETFSINQLIEKQLDFFKEQAKQKSIEMKIEFETNLKINANKGLTEIMLNNLLLNAISHNVQNGMIHLNITSKIFTISNSGKPNQIPAEKLFSRFSKSNDSARGNGLGLAIVKKIADSNNWDISYSFSENNHTFSIHFQ